MGKPESLRNNFLMKGTTNTSASQRTQVRWIDGSYLMIYAYKTQDIASCKTLKMTISWSFSYNSVVKLHGEKVLEPQHDRVISQFVL